MPTRLLSLEFHGWTLVQALQHPAACMSRTVDCLELWAGVGSVAHAARNMGFKSIAVDKLDCPDGACTELYDITSRKGFERAMTYVLSVVVGGLLVMAPCCSSFGFLNLSKTKRSVNNPEGDISYNKVQDGNSQAMAAAFLFALASIRSVKAVVENPTSSWLFELPVWRPVRRFQLEVHQRGPLLLRHSSARKAHVEDLQVRWATMVLLPEGEVQLPREKAHQTHTQVHCQ